MEEAISILAHAHSPAYAHSLCHRSSLIGCALIRIIHMWGGAWSAIDDPYQMHKHVEGTEKIALATQYRDV